MILNIKFLDGFRWTGFGLSFKEVMLKSLFAREAFIGIELQESLKKIKAK
jgi:hypothetical protein